MVWTSSKSKYVNICYSGIRCFFHGNHTGRIQSKGEPLLPQLLTLKTTQFWIAWFGNVTQRYFAWNQSKFGCVLNTKSWISGQRKHHLFVFHEISSALVWLVALFILILTTCSQPAIIPSAASCLILKFPHLPHCLVSLHMVCDYVWLEINHFLLFMHYMLASMRFCNRQTVNVTTGASSVDRLVMVTLFKTLVEAQIYMKKVAFL